MAGKYKHFKLYTNQNIMGVVMLSMLAGVVGVLVLFGVILLYPPAAQVLGVSTP
ncbi:MAG: hypothetical protein HY426_03735 [Candidatus Levybacteria bacterium]|nr:hypothetical protein [Candidatus Levybacteria bacterium]